DQCHTTSTWTGSTFKHTVFSINHGRKVNQCSTCHPDATNFKTYTCYSCHTHKPANMVKTHQKRNVKNYNEDCISCHGRGKKKKGERGKTLEVNLDCPTGECVAAVECQPSSAQCPANHVAPSQETCGFASSGGCPMTAPAKRQTSLVATGLIARLKLPPAL